MSSAGVSKNPTFKLFYFDIRGLAEPIRFLLAYGGQKYEDVRITKEEWPALKSTMPLGAMPVLEVDGHRVHQSVSIARYVAKLAGLAGSNDWENLVIDTAVDTVSDLRIKVSTATHGTDEALKAKKLLTLTTETMPFYLGKLESLVKENDGHLALSKLTWADVYFASLFEFKVDVLENYPGLLGLVNAVIQLEPIKAWIKKRPVTNF